MNIVALIVQLISGAVGGNVAGALLKQYSLGPLGNSIAGILGGGIGGQILGMVLNSGGAAAAGGDGMDMGSIPSSVSPAEASAAVCSWPSSASFDRR